MTCRVLTAMLFSCIVIGLLIGCGSPESKMLGQWVGAKEAGEINISKNGDALNVEVIDGNGQSGKFPGTYKDGTLTIQNMWVVVTFQHDDKTDELVVNSGGQQDRMHRK